MHTYTGRINKKISTAQYSCWHLGDNHEVLKKQALAHSMLFFRATVGIWGPSCMPSCRFCTEWLLGSIQHSHWHRIPEWTRNKNATSQGLAQKPMKALKALMFPCCVQKNNTDQDFQMWRGTSMLAGNALQRRNGDVKVQHLKLALRDNIAINTGLIAKQVPEQGSPLSLAYMVVDQNSFSQKWPFLEKSTLGKLHKKKNPPHPILDYEWKYAWQTIRT